MLVSDIILDVRDNLVEPNPAFWSDAELIRYIVRAENLLADVARGMLVQRVSIDLLTGINEYDLPTNFLSQKVIFIDTEAGTGNPNNWVRLRSTSLEKQAQENPNWATNDSTTFAMPVSGFIEANTLFVSPTPDQNYPAAILMWYEAMPVPVTSSSSVLNFPDQFRECIGGFVRWNAWRKEKDVDQAAEGRSDFLAGVAQVRRLKKKMQLDRRNRVDIDSWVPFSPNGSMVTGFNPFDA